MAREAGVSVSAVSKVLRDAYGVSAEMRDKVQGAIEGLGYRPRTGARSMRGRTFTVGVLLSDIRSPFAPEIVEGVQAEFEGSAYQVVLGPGGPTPDRQQRSIETLIDSNVDGLVLIAPNVPTARLEELADIVPVVVIARHGRGRNYDSVVDDDAMGAALMVEHLADLGHRRICHISHPMGELRRPSVLSHTARADGYVAAMLERGLEPDVVTTSYTEDGGYRGALEALGRANPPTAVFAGADIAALGVLRAASERGLRVPEDLTVTGYDNTNVSAVPQISLTTIDQSGTLTGSVSARLLRERLEGRDAPVSYSVTPKLVERNTSAPPPAS
ncbi:LacI family transcriptional regulator [Kibdelosporangium banguiense]|uniref:LacI family transcriptional regulator n=1 Tax=Kibdelosporangium banguiense TaxID=1365924 RepID=A0ABS4TX46_9PSEU|nr:LacI family DNA-binding transcriptional regulator [Kibdelosporangium banguiense]MBP2328975.1 LacI family transcriptional regulator [Kibdelosporangium banguiense]